MKQTIVIAIVFKYDREYQELPGIIIDLYHIVNSPVVKNASAVHIITDITEDEDLRMIRNAFTKGIVNGSASRIIDYIKEKEYLIAYQNNPEWLMQQLALILASTPENILFYYTGHGREDCLVLPAGDVIDHQLFRDFWKQHLTRKTKEVTMIFDCCQGMDLGLSYIYDKGWQYRSTKDYYLPLVTVFNAAQKGERTLTESKGSIFTRSLFFVINKNNKLISYQELLPWLQNECNQHQSEQTCQIQSNDPFSWRLTPWLLGTKESIHEDKIQEIVIVEL